MRSYGLSAYDVEYKLPLLDTYHTDLLRVCPDYLSPLQCVPGRYRRFDGLCNNLIHPTWGARLTTFPRYDVPKRAKKGGAWTPCLKGGLKIGSHLY